MLHRAVLWTLTNISEVLTTSIVTPCPDYMCNISEGTCHSENLKFDLNFFIFLLWKSTVYICSFLDAVLSFRNILYLFQVVVSSEGLEDNFTLGLAALLGGDFAFLPHKTKLRKVAPVDWCGDSKKNAIPNCTFTLYLRVKFFMPSLRGVRYVSAHHTYLYQERRAKS
jgi:hypothetical protein